MKQRVLLVGCGDHSSENLIPSLAAIPTIEVMGVSDTNPDNAGAATRWFPNATTFDPSRMDEATVAGFDAVVAAATPQVHEVVAQLALSQSIPVFVEKPPAVQTADLQRLAELATTKSIITCVGHNLRHTEAAIHFRDCVERTSFGNPIAMEMRYCASKPRGTRWGLSSPLRSFLLSHANHAIDLMIYYMGPIHQVVAARASADVDGGIAITAQFKFKSGAIGNLLATSYAPHFTVGATVVSDNGKIAMMQGLHEVEVYGESQLGKRWGNRWVPRTLETGFRFAGYQTELERFFAAVANNDLDGANPTFQEEVEIYKAMDEIERSICGDEPELCRV
jgi:predicted dehydrogenase